MKIVYGIFKPEDFGNDENFLPIVKPVCQTHHYREFHYFSPGHIYNYYEAEGRIFFLAFKNEIKPENIIGVLKTGVYNTYSANGESYRAINYVDVNKNFKRKGIASKLLEMLDNYVKTEKNIDLICCSSITRKGEKKGMRNLVSKKITGKLFFNN